MRGAGNSSIRTTAASAASNVSRLSAGMPSGMMCGAAAIALTLFDHDTPLWLDPSMSATSDVTKWLKFHTGAPVIADSSICSFALIGDARSLPSLDRFAFGSNEYPDRSTTLILQVSDFTSGAPLLLEGPGIETSATIAPAQMPRHFIEQWKQNTKRFPRGIDIILATAEGIACLPRTTRIKTMEA